MNSSMRLIPTVTPWMTNQNEWTQLIMIGAFYGIMWTLILILWLFIKCHHSERNHNNYSNSDDISQLIIENNQYTPISPL